MHSPFDSNENLREAFAAGLERLLGTPDLGAYVLVLANALFDEHLHSRLQGPLQRRFAEHAARVRAALTSGRDLKGAADDLLVFLKLLAMGPDSVAVTERRFAGPWEVQFNLLRAFRPKRLSANVGGGAQVAFNAAGFHFNKHFLRQETFWRGELAGRRVDLLYNKFPFVDLHGLLVPERELAMPQFLTRDYHEYFWRLCETLAPHLPGLGLGYNSYGAHASVNHLHIQVFVREQPLPLTADRWVHNGGVQTYPAPCAVFHRPDQAWRYLDHLQREAEPYNLLYLPGRIYCLPRARQGDYRHADWTGGFAWYEMAGGMVAFNWQDYESLTAEQIETELIRVGVAD